jgi:hypothetical protein
MLENGLFAPLENFALRNIKISQITRKKPNVDAANQDQAAQTSQEQELF